MFTADEVFRFTKEATGMYYLMLKLVIIFCYFGALRMSECCPILISDVTMTPEGLLVKVLRKKTDKSGLGQTFLIPKEYTDYYKEYLHLRKPFTNARLWLTYVQKKDNFKNSPMGINTMRVIPSLVATYLGLEKPTEYTGHALRATSATVLADSGITMENLKRHGQWKSTTVVEGYIRDSKKMKTDIATALNNTPPTTTATTCTTTTTATITQPDSAKSEQDNHSGPIFINCVFEGNFLYQK